MVLCKPDCDSNDRKLRSVILKFLTAAALLFSAAYRPITARSSGVKAMLYFHFLSRLAWFHASSHSNAAITAWFSSLRPFGDSCTWLGIGRLSFDLKYWRILIPMINSSNVIVLSCVNENTCWVFEWKGHGHVWCIIHCVLPFLWFFWMQVTEKLALCKQKHLVIKARPIVFSTT